MEALITVGDGHAGLLVWVLWALLGALVALFAQRLTGGKRSLLFDIVIGVVAGVLGGRLSIGFLGDSPMQLFLISILSALFFAIVALWITAALYKHFKKDENL